MLACCVLFVARCLLVCEIKGEKGVVILVSSVHRKNAWTCQGRPLTIYNINTCVAFVCHLMRLGVM